MQALSPRTLRSVGLVTLAMAFFLAATAILLLSVFDGYWRTGTYGFLVLPGLIAAAIGMPMFVRAFWAHVVRGSPVIGHSGGRFHYLREGQLSVESALVKEVSVSKEGRFGLLCFMAADGTALQKYPLVLSSVDGSVVADRANQIVDDRRGKPTGF